MKPIMGATFGTALALRAEPASQSHPSGLRSSRGAPVLRLVEERPTQRGDGGPKIRVFINDSHVALVLRVKREMCVGEEVRAVAI